MESPLHITVDNSVLARNDFSVSVDEAKLRGFFDSFGVSGDLIERTNFQLKNEDSSKRGYYGLGEDGLAVYVGNFWNNFCKNHALAEDLALGRKKSSRRHFKGLLTTRRLSGYLSNQTVPLERRLAFAERLIENGTNRLVNKTFFHEARHLMDYEAHPKLLRANQGILKWGGLSLGILEGWLIGSMLPVPEIAIYIASAYYGCNVSKLMKNSINPWEWRARKFADKRSKEPQWRNIITLIPNLEWRGVKMKEYSGSKSTVV